MLNLKLVQILEKNKLAADQPWLTFLELTLDPTNFPADIIYLVNNVDDVVHKGITYSKFFFNIQEVPMQSGGSLPQVQLDVSNVNQAMQAEMELHNGGVDANVKLIVLSAQDLNGDPELEATFTVVNASCDEQFAHFTLGAENPLRKNFPNKYFLANFCRHDYNTPAFQSSLDPRGIMCGYEGNLATCSKLLRGTNGCEAHNNVINFGGQPGINTTGFRDAVAR